MAESVPRTRILPEQLTEAIAKAQNDFREPCLKLRGFRSLNRLTGQG